MRTCSFSSSTLRVSMTKMPPSGMASRALRLRFIRICSICEGSAVTMRRADSRKPRISTRSPMSLWRRLVTSSTEEFKLILRGCRTWRRAKARICAVGLIGDFLETVTGARAGLGVFQAHLGPSQDGAEDIVKIVGDAAGEAANGFKFLQGADMLLETSAGEALFGLADFALDGG